MKFVRILLMIGYYVLAIGSLFILGTLNDLSRIGYVLLACAMPLVPYLFTKVTKIKLTKVIILAYDLFVFGAMILGNIYGFYRFSGFDKILHTLSGVLISALVFIIYYKKKKGRLTKDRSDLVITLLFTMGVNMFVAFGWECFEFALLVFFDNDAIHHYDQGVYDTMTDMIVCFLGGLVTIAFIYHYFKTKKDNILIKAAKDFLHQNTVVS